MRLDDKCCTVTMVIPGLDCGEGLLVKIFIFHARLVTGFMSSFIHFSLSLQFIRLICQSLRMFVVFTFRGECGA